MANLLRKLGDANPPLVRADLTVLLALGAIVCALLSSCTVGPDYTRHDPVLPPTYQSESGKTGNAPMPKEEWWKNFNDPPLNQLIDTALKNSPSLELAEARVRSARALRGIAGAADNPDLNLGAEYHRSHGSDNVPTGVPPGGMGPGITSNLWQSGFDSTWELDVFGANRRAVEATNAEVSAYRFDLADIRLTLVAEIIRTDIEARTAFQRIQVATSLRQSEQERSNLIQTLVKSGLASILDLHTARARVEAAGAVIPQIQDALKSARFHMAALTGILPDALPREFPLAAPLPEPVLAFSAGLPSDLLKRRPDLRSAERRLAAANARIGIAQADLYPHFSLTAIAGLESLQLSSFHTGSSAYYAVGPSLGWNIFDAGKVRFEVMDATARKDAEAATYRGAVLNALQDAESALDHVGNTQIRLRGLDAEKAAYHDSAHDEKLLYVRGIDSYLPVLDTEIAALQSSDRSLQGQRDALLALISLYKSVGGAWDTDGPDVEISNSPK